MGPLGELGALFNPGMRHEIEERKSRANRREEEGNARDGDLRIDLASGVAVINIPGRSGPTTPPRTASPAEPDLPAAGDGAPTAAPAAAVPPGDTRSTAARPAHPRTSARKARADTAAPSAAPGTPGRGPVPSSKASRAAR